ncbi:MAG: MTH938/NDUFAF3 family protein [Candidatus Marinimicrobia bacterium]|nr:MTH938/NDUFAF3 family protein [Candidatus Neomarinimicrobiota bacterium]MCF7839912.1 MTH938/NDUFAF3 family protein [Candidatus Neomarinimicrobiota bacterium]
MKNQLRSPQIKRLVWGEIELEDGSRYKDVKLWPGGARSWDWRETGTHHSPGILPADVEELLEKGTTEVVLSQGQLKRLQVDSATLQLLAERNIPVHVLSTWKAVQLYNDLCRSRPVGGLFHSTC